jgi:hypothetical protein
VTRPTDYRAYPARTAERDWAAWDIRDGLNKWTAQLRLHHHEHRWKLLIGDGKYAESLRQIKTYDAWLKWLSARL